MLDLSIIIPFKDKSELTLACLDSLKKYGGDIKEILLISNNSTKEEVTKIKSAAANLTNATVKIYNEPFNFQAINNWGIANTTGKVVMLLNNDIELTKKSSITLRTMYQEALKDDIGAVGCVLLYEDKKTVQHAGVYLIPGGTADHLYIGKSISYAKKGTVDIHHGRQFSAVTAAAVMIERKKLKQVNGLNEKFIICGGDVDLCIRLEKAGYKTWMVGTDFGYMIHKESKSRSMISVPYVDFVESYKSYVSHYDINSGDKYLPWKELQNV